MLSIVKNLIGTAILFLLSLIAFFYNLRLSNEIDKSDLLIIWLSGSLCWLFYANILFMSSGKPIFFIRSILIFLGLLLLSKFCINENGLNAFITVFCFIAIFLCFQKGNYFLGHFIFLWAVILSFLLQVSLGIWQGTNSNWESLSIRGWLYNSGFFGNYLASITPLLLAGILTKQAISKQLRISLALLFFTSIFLLFFTLARAAIIGTIAGCFLITFLRVTKPEYNKGWKIVVVAVASIIITGVFFLYSLKPKSALGRLTIYRVSANIIKDNWLLGIGPNQFSAVYNNYQSNYFKNNDVPFETQLLADNTFEAFNSVLQVLVEYGVVGLLFLIWILFFLVRHYNVRKTLDSGIWLQNGSFACIVSIFVSSLFSNPFHVTPILVIFIYHLSVVCPLQVLPVKSLPPKRSILPVILIISFVLFVFYYGYSHYNAERKWHKASDLAKYGSYLEAKKYYQASYQILKHNGDYLFNYGAEASLAGEYQLSINLLERARSYISSNNVFIYLGDSYTAVNQFSLAEQNYLHAIYMVPSHLFPKYKLVKLYKIWGKEKEAEYWRNKALTFPVKVRSSFTDELIKELKQDF